MVVDPKGLRDAAMARGRAAFLTQYAGFFMVVTPNPERLNIGFRTVETRAMSQGDDEDEDDELAFELIHVVKAPGNPYPERISLGRAPNCDIVLRDPSVSKLHAHFRTRGAIQRRLELTDLNSRNGTEINGQKVAANDPVLLAAGDTLKFGQVAARLLDAHQMYEFLR